MNVTEVYIWQLSFSIPLAIEMKKFKPNLLSLSHDLIFRHDRSFEWENASKFSRATSAKLTVFKE